MPVVAAAAAAVFSSAVTFATAVGTAALTSVGLGSLATMGIASFTGSLTIGAVVGAVSIGSTAMSIFSMARKPKASAGSPSPLAFKADPNAFLSYVAGGPVGVGGNQVFGQTSASKNKYLTYVTALSAGGPVHSVQPFKANDTEVTFGADGGAGALGTYNKRMWQKFGLGAAVGAAALTMANVTGNRDTPGNNGGHPYEWTAQHTLPSIAHSMWTLLSDPDKYPQLPKPLWEVRGGPVYDPRKDSTFPGGNGPQRWNDRNTWSTEGNQNPFLQALTFGIGHIFNGVRLGGVGLPITAIDVPSFVYAANVADANGWKIAWVWHTGMRKWDVLTTMMQAGAGTPLVRGSKLSCMVEAPRVSIGVITDEDIKGAFSITGSANHRERKNTIIPRCKSAFHKWTVQPFGAVTAQTYLDEDGDERPEEVEYESIADNGDGGRQLRQIAAYDLANMREGLGGTLPLPMKFMKYRAGDCLTVNAPSTLLNGQKVVVLKREVDTKSRRVNLTVRSETDGKHDFALGRTANAPPSPNLTGVDPTVVEPPAPGAWVVEPGQTPGGGGSEGGMPVVVIAPANPDPANPGGAHGDDPAATNVVVRYRREGTNPATGEPWPWVQEEFPATAPKIELKGLAPLTTYEVEIAYRVRGIVGLWQPYGLVTTQSLVAQNALALGNREAQAILDELDAIPGQINDAVSNLNIAVGAIDAQINNPATGLLVRVGAAETATDQLAQRVQTTEQQINQPGTGLLARTGQLDTAVANLQLGKADASRLLLVEARATGEGALNNQATFATPWDNGAVPVGWSSWSSGELNTRVAGLESANGLRYAVAAGQDRGVVQNPTSTPSLGGLSAGWYVLEATVKLNSGSLRGAGLLAQALSGTTDIGGQSVNFANDPDIDGIVQGAGVPGRTYRWSKLVRMENWSGQTMNGVQFYAMGGWSAFDWGTARDVTFTRALIRPASAAEIDVGRARSGGADLSARFGSVETATANLAANKADATRVTYLEAGSEDVYLTRNPTFTLYDNAATTGFTTPNFWYAWGERVDDSHREPGYAGRWAWWSHNNKPGATGDVGMSQDFANNPRLAGMPAGYYVLELELALDAGQLGGAGVYCYFSGGGANSTARIDCGVDKTVDGTVLGYAYDVASSRHSWRKLVKLENANGGNMVFHLMTDWDGFDAAGRPKVIRFQRAGIRRATAQEVAAERADTNAGSALSRVGTVETATAELKANGANGGNLIGNASLQSMAGWRIVPFNLVEAGLDRNATGINFPDDNWHPAGENVLACHVNGNSPGWYCDFVSDDVAVEQTKTYEFGVRVGQHRTVTECYIGFTNGTDTGYVPANLTDGTGRYAGENYAGGQNLGGYGYFWGKVTIPAGYNRAFMILRRATSNPGQADSWSWFTRPFIREIPAYQTGPSAWDAGMGTWLLRASWRQGTAVPGAETFISAESTNASGRPTSSVAIGAQQFAVFNQVGQNWLKALEVVGGNVLLTGGLQAGAFIRLGNGNGWPVALRPVDFNLSDGEVCSFGTDLSGLPSLSFALNNLAPLNSGETYDVRAVNLTSTGFTMSAKISVPATPSAQNVTGPGYVESITYPGRTLYLDAKPNAADGTYLLSVNGQQNHRIIPSGGGVIIADNEDYQTVELRLYAYNGVWQEVGTLFASSISDPDDYFGDNWRPVTVSESWYYQDTVTLPANTSHINVGRVGASNGLAGSIYALGPISWQSQGTGAGQRSATPNGQKSKVTVRPQ